ncbi:MAG TPA: metallophosphoesterase family protein [Candidatus Hydrogenedentes bacterium]|nr:metallophosphoesterase family protein [Candidatus Hydrogenedentota bacterium]
MHSPPRALRDAGMILGVMSDTHGNTDLMRSVAASMARLFSAEIIFHLGDDYRDAVELSQAGYDVRMVPGLWCPEYHDARIPRRIHETFDGVTVAGVHAEKDLRHIERAADIVLTGHTHKPNLAILGRTFYINPGHLTARIHRGQPASYAVIKIVPGEITAVIREAATDAIRETLSIPRDLPPQRGN